MNSERIVKRHLDSDKRQIDAFWLLGLVSIIILPVHGDAPFFKLLLRAVTLFVIWAWRQTKFTSFEDFSSHLRAVSKVINSRLIKNYL